MMQYALFLYSQFTVLQDTLQKESIANLKEKENF